jgi:hypothetical protein
MLKRVYVHPLSLSSTDENLHLGHEERWNSRLCNTGRSTAVTVLYCDGTAYSTNHSNTTRHVGAWGGRRIALIHFQPRHYMGVSGQRYAPAALYPGVKTPSTHCTRGWVGRKAGLDTDARGQILCFCRESNLDRLVVHPVARHYTDWATRLTITALGIQ